MPRFFTAPFVSLLPFATLLEAGTALAAPTPVFSGSYSAAPLQVTMGQAITLSATLTDVSGSLSNGNATLAVLNSSKQVIFQKYWTGQYLNSGQRQSYQTVWTPTSPGTYTYYVGVFDSTWSTAYLSQTPSQLTVGGNTPPPPNNNRTTDAYGWVACSSSFVPLSDAQASAMVVSAPENRPGNKAVNQYWPSGGEISAFRYGETDLYGRTAVQTNPYTAYVTGGYSGTTDQIIQWGAAKWGIPANWLRAIAVSESNWNQLPPGGICPPSGGYGCGDLTTVYNNANYPAYARYGSNKAFQSLGIAQIKWNHPDANNSGTGTEPLRWKSTTFNVDYMAATVRFYFDNPKGARSSWGDGYWSCDNWRSIGAWFLPYPWNNSGQQGYVQRIQTILGKRPWAQPGF